MSWRVAGHSVLSAQGLEVLRALVSGPMGYLELQAALPFVMELGAVKYCVARLAARGFVAIHHRVPGQGQRPGAGNPRKIWALTLAGETLVAACAHIDSGCVAQNEAPTEKPSATPSTAAPAMIGTTQP